MPWAPNRVFDDEAIDERSMIVRAMGSDGEYFGPAAHEQHLVAADMADHLSAVGKCG
jgi:hypothetical protein